MEKLKRIPKAAPEVREPVKRTSNRKYEERICLQTGRKFIPTNKRQKFIDAQARIDYNNDKRAVVGKVLNDFSKQIKLHEKILAQGEQRLKELSKKTLGRDILIYSGYDFNIYSERTVNSTTGKYILWAINYGIEGIDAEKESVIIHNKNKENGNR
jgi:disulfide oxidoreductase YuzD